MQVVLAEARGLCAGLQRAIEIIETALRQHGSPVYVRRETLHPAHLVDRLRAKGVRFVDSFAKVPPGSTVIFSPHGVSRTVEQEVEARRLTVVDATCPLISKIHADGQRHVRSGGEVVVIGHADHPETEAILDRLDGHGHLIRTVEDVARLELANPGASAYSVQTTLSIDDLRPVLAALRDRFPGILAPDSEAACHAAQHRQQAVWGLAGMVDLVLVVGAKASPSCRRLIEIAERRGTRTHLLETPLAFDREWLRGVKRVGITAGLSTHDDLVQDLVETLRNLGAVELWTLPEPKEASDMFHDPLPPAISAAMGAC